ncbi:hypothetical protein PV325_008330 [Microctonus aethiopoides]|nr:hypothetical protein PV325_008330 [Microctonus aethiopoides]
MVRSFHWCSRMPQRQAKALETFVFSTPKPHIADRLTRQPPWQQQASIPSQNAQRRKQQTLSASIAPGQTYATLLKQRTDHTQSAPMTSSQSLITSRPRNR